MRFRPAAGHLPQGAGDAEGWRELPALERGFRLTWPARSSHRPELLFLGWPRRSLLQVRKRLLMMAQAGVTSALRGSGRPGCFVDGGLSRSSIQHLPDLGLPVPKNSLRVPPAPHYTERSGA
jgi:hypothetical protein